MKSPFVCLLLGLSLAVPVSLRGSTYYVDAQKGCDSNSGATPDHPWKTLQKVNEGSFGPGDRILLAAGSRWEGQLVLRSSGSQGAPIVVDRYGAGSMPRIDGAGKVENTLEITNVEQVEVRRLELTNLGEQAGVRRAVLIAASNFGTAHHIVVSDLYIHDVNGTNERKETGGILFRTIGNATPSRFDGLTIARNIIWKVDRSAIVGESNEFSRSRWYPSRNVVISDNFAEDIGGDGIVPWATDGALIEGNIVLRCNQRAGAYNAGIWPWSADNSVFELNEAAYTHGTLDGEGFDSDYNSKNTHFLYNYSHDNDGGFMLICTPGKRNPLENIGNAGTVIEYNISHNDHTRIFNLSGADETTVEHNVVYIGAQDDVQILLVSSWDGWSNGASFRSNIFDVAGAGRFGHELRRNPDGTYEIGPGWGGAQDIQFERNQYFGRILDVPNDPSAVIERQYRAPTLDWNEPTFDAAHPEGFSTFLAEHRRWMLRLFASQFGEAPHLQDKALTE